jgi:hypothetical protein
MSEWLTTGEMIDQLKPGEIAIDDRGNVVKYIRGQLCWENGDLFYVNIDQKVLGKWRILPRYVSFEEAMKALMNGKTVWLWQGDKKGAGYYIDRKSGKLWAIVGELAGKVDVIQFGSQWTIEE